MSDEPHELVIIRHRHDHEEGHHGGAWKIAFADFMTALMALFLVLWLISTMTPKTKTSIARYFNPVKLVELTPLKKGFNDPVDSDAVPGTEGKGQTPTDGPVKRPVGDSTTDGSGNAMVGKATHSEAALFRDPYAVLAEIADADAPPKPVMPKPQATETPVDAPEPFRDPFAPLPHETASDEAPGIKVLELSAPSKRSDGDAATTLQFDGYRAPVKDETVAGAPSRALAAKTADATKPSAPSDIKADAASAAAAIPAASAPAPAQGAAAARQAAKAMTPVATAAPNAANAVKPAQAPPADTPAMEAARLQGQIAQAIANGAGGQPAPNVEVRGTDEGLLISLTDQQSFAMFNIGSAEPQAKTIHAMEIVAKLLNARPGQVIIRGFTDARPYKSATYDNWRLSSSRAHMAQYMLIRGGLDEKRIAAIEGLADRRPKVTSDPMAPENRRIEILLRPEKP